MDDAARFERVMEALHAMQKQHLAQLQQAANG